MKKEAMQKKTPSSTTMSPPSSPSTLPSSTEATQTPTEAAEEAELGEAAGKNRETQERVDVKQTT